ANSLDVQYYVIANDDTGRLFLRHLRDAARRGVRVRLLVDDLHTAGADVLLSGLAAEENVEVRLFNPFPAGRRHISTRILLSLFDMRRVNRRMHNKLFIADGSMAVIGGRNIANDYFRRLGNTNFIDIDALAVGQIVPQLERSFDDYWNSKFSYSIGSIVLPALSRQLSRDAFERLTRTALNLQTTVAERDLLGNRPLAIDLQDGVVPLTWADAHAFADEPDKSLRPVGSAQHPAQVPAQSVRMHLQTLVRSAKNEVIQTSPYLIPGDDGMTSVRLLRARGVSITMITNSLAGTDEGLVHAGYQRYRPALLEAGVRLYEISPSRMASARRDGRFVSAGGRLHGKAVIVDRREVFIGSL
ncbi:MAG: phospholipase D family protein, partial [Alcaligenaceae bacterium]